MYDFLFLLIFSLIGTSAKITENDSVNNTLESDVATQDTTQDESGSTMFNTSSSLSFADLACKTGFGTVTSPTQKKVFEGAGTPLFANLNCSAEGNLVNFYFLYIAVVCLC